MLLTWTAPTHPSHERSKRWYVVGATLLFAFAAYGVITGSWSTALVAMLIGAMYYLLRDHSFDPETITISTTGVQLGKTFTRWEDMNGFWFLRTSDYTELHLVPKGRKPDLVIQTDGIEPAIVKTTLESKIQELSDKRESLFDAFIRITKL